MKRVEGLIDLWPNWELGEKVLDDDFGQPVGVYYQDDIDDIICFLSDKNIINVDY